MSSFTENVGIEPLPKLNMWRTTKPFSYAVGNEGSLEVIEVPK